MIYIRLNAGTLGDNQETTVTSHVLSIPTTVSYMPYRANKSLAPAADISSTSAKPESKWEVQQLT